MIDSDDSDYEAVQFEEAWKNVVEIVSLEDKLKDGMDEKERKETERKIRSLENKITPSAKRVAADRNRPLIRAITRYIQKNGAPSNIADILSWLRSQGFCIANDNEAKPANGITARTARLIISKIFELETQMGKKPKQS